MEDFDVNYDPWNVTGRNKTMITDESFIKKEQEESVREESVEKSTYPDEEISYSVAPIQNVDDE